MGTGAAGFGGAAAGLAAAGAAGAAAAGFAGAAGAGFVGDETEPDSEEPAGVAFTPPALAGGSAAGFGSPSGGGELGDLMSSGIIAQAQTYGSVCIEKNDNFYQLESSKSTDGFVISRGVIVSRSEQSRGRRILVSSRGRMNDGTVFSPAALSFPVLSKSVHVGGVKKGVHRVIGDGGCHSMLKSLIN